MVHVYAGKMVDCPEQHADSAGEALLEGSQDTARCFELLLIFHRPAVQSWLYA